MDLLHTSTSKDMFGVYHIQVMVGSKAYSFCLNSEKGLRTFNYYYQRGWTGKALNVLKKMNISKGGEG